MREGSEGSSEAQSYLLLAQHRIMNETRDSNLVDRATAVTIMRTPSPNALSLPATWYSQPPRWPNDFRLTTPVLAGSKGDSALQLIDPANYR